MKKIFKTRFGSHLYGTDTPSSDLDYKGIFLESMENIILKKDKDTLFENITDKREDGRNNVAAVDCEFIELRRFIKDCLEGQTYALDMLFSPINMWESYSSEWTEILENREKLLSKDVAPYIGYCRHQANKYGLKGSRLGELLRVIKWAKELPPNSRITEHLLTLYSSEFVKTEKTTYSNTGRELEQEFLNVLGRKFELKTRIKDMLPCLENLNEKYGNRAIDAMKNEGIDWKAVSHAFRCMNQLDELATTGRIIFPLKSASFLRDIKLGKIPWDSLNNELYELMELTVKKVEVSKFLNDKPDYEFWDKWITKKYLSNYINI